MHARTRCWTLSVAVLGLAVTTLGHPSLAQNPPRPAQATQAARGRPERAPDYPVRAPAPPQQVAHGQQLFRSNCAFCHGSDARGGETGPNLVRDVIVLRDQNGEVITPIVQNGIPARGMPKFTLSAAEISDIAAWLHAQPLSDRGAPSTLDILVGNARDGAAYFSGAGRCTQCHSTRGDLAGIGAKYDAKTIQNLVVSGGGMGVGRRSATPPKVPPTTVASPFRPARSCRESWIISPPSSSHCDSRTARIAASRGTIPFRRSSSPIRCSGTSTCSRSGGIRAFTTSPRISSR